MSKGHYIYSYFLDEMVLESFYYKNHLYVWNEVDLVYYDADSDESWFTEVPADAVPR